MNTIYVPEFFLEAVVSLESIKTDEKCYKAGEETNGGRRRVCIFVFMETLREF